MIGMIRAPDSYVYPAPFNLIETFLIAPFECVNVFSLKFAVKLDPQILTFGEPERQELCKIESLGYECHLFCSIGLHCHLRIDF